jgi:hypothetical protein
MTKVDYIFPEAEPYIKKCDHYAEKYAFLVGDENFCDKN